MDEKKMNEIDAPTAEPTPSAATAVSPETSFTVDYRYTGIYHPDKTEAAAPAEPVAASPVAEPGVIAYSEAAGEMRAPEVTLPEEEPVHPQTDRFAREDDETVIPTEPETPLYAEVAERPCETATESVSAVAAETKPQKTRVSGFAVMSFLCGLVALLSSWLGYAGALMSIVGLAFVAVSVRRDPNKKMRVFAILGLIVCLVALVVSGAFIAVRWLPGLDLSFLPDTTAFLG